MGVRFPPSAPNMYKCLSSAGLKDSKRAPANHLLISIYSRALGRKDPQFRPYFRPLESVNQPAVIRIPSRRAACMTPLLFLMRSNSSGV